MQGFKSFADQTMMTFDNGVTAIVGERLWQSNVGCVRGPGEQRARMLRAKMEEVTQAVGATRRQRGRSVALFRLRGRWLPSPSEVVITCRLSRSGESDTC
jgi:chromosome segregation protein